MVVDKEIPTAAPTPEDSLELDGGTGHRAAVRTVHVAMRDVGTGHGDLVVADVIPDGVSPQPQASICRARDHQSPTDERGGQVCGKGPLRRRVVGDAMNAWGGTRMSGFDLREPVGDVGVGERDHRPVPAGQVCIWTARHNGPGRDAGRLECRCHGKSTSRKPQIGGYDTARTRAVLQASATTPVPTSEIVADTRIATFQPAARSSPTWVAMTTNKVMFDL